MLVLGALTQMQKVEMTYVQFDGKYQSSPRRLGIKSQLHRNDCSETLGSRILQANAS